MSKSGRPLRLVSSLALLVVAVDLARAEEIAIPPPSGSHGVGRLIYHWTDTSRSEPLSGQKDARREVLIFVWYPAEVDPGAERALYLPHFERIESTLGAAMKKDL